MILSRIIHHLKTQNWTAVAIEFVIVIACVAVGFEVSASGERAAERAYEQDLLLRLHREIVNIEQGRERQQDRIQRDRDLLVSVRPALFLAEERDRISSGECIALLESHLLDPAPDSLPALDELVATGRMESIRDEAIRSATSAFLQRRESTRAQTPMLLSGITNLPRAFPDLLYFSLTPDPEVPDGDGWNREAHCALEGMQADRQFRTLAAQNIAQYRQLLGYHYAYVGEALTELHQAIDVRLDIEHPAESGAEP